ncbi:kinase-like protein [Dendrothele bispora CBS 962.96]|uniref:Kinase-like protein n=1 Tax=Dendrothele bispora (strain CBS 962.96) TaxID=1314807 RepID=A0A4S8MU36_DENBC|nr:kinase-like protein [Dendrothele bispora CBS 962.96]
MLSYSAPISTDYFHHNDPRLTPSRIQKDRPLSISTNISSSSPLSSSPSTAASSKFLRTPYISSRPLPSPAPTSRPWSVSRTPAHSRPASHSSSLASSAVEDVFAPGDVVGEGALLQGEPLKLVSIGAAPTRSNTPDYEEPAKEFEVKKRLGAGSYAVVYLVSEVLYRPPPSEDGHSSAVGSIELEGNDTKPSIVYGREYAIKCLSKANLDEEALAAQMTEVTIHQSLRSHPNIVTLHRTLETSSLLLLLLEYVPGEDLFYFLEQARDHYESDSPNSTDSISSSSHTPPTPSLLSNVNPSQQLSRTRLRLISSMFSQMCDAVAACHDQQVFHRDIKPENFIVTDGWTTTPDGRQERKVVVKLTDFGLSTTDVQSSDMDCGSAPYMSFECRNNMAPTYRPRAADVWSLGIVLINMLYHCNPWTDTAHGSCSSFSLYLRDPVNFFMNRFAGMTKPVAEVLANRVFNILDDPEDDSKRISAAGFGAWIRDLSELLCDQPPTSSSSKTHQRAISISSSTQGFPISSSTPMSHRPSSRHPSSGTTVRTPAIPSRSLSRAPSLEPAYEKPETTELSTVIDQEVEEEREDQEQLESRSSTTKRRKRGARKGKGTTATATTPTTPKDETLTTLAVASQSLAREISKASKASSGRSASSSVRRSRPYEPVSMYPVPTSLLTTSPRVSPSVLAQPPVPPLPTASSSSSTRTPAPVTKKPSKWKLSFGKAHAASVASGRLSPTEDAAPSDTNNMSHTASNVANVLMGLDATPSSVTPAPGDDGSLYGNRGRRGRGSPTRNNVHHSRSPLPPGERWDKRAISPNSTRSGRPLASSSSSVVSSNWRSSMSTTSSAGASTSAFTRYSNSSVRSVSTAATSVSSNSWRTNDRPPVRQPQYPNVPKNIKIMEGVPWELFEVHRGQRPEPIAEVFNAPTARKQRTRKPKDLPLDTINERPQISYQKSSPDFSRRTDASMSTSDLGSPGARSSSGGGNGGGGGVQMVDDGDGPKKVQKGQINALAKMLSALRR